MSNCYSCEQILSDNGGGVLCILKRYRKYLIGIAIGAVVVYLFSRRVRK